MGTDYIGTIRMQAIPGLYRAYASITDIPSPTKTAASPPMRAASYMRRGAHHRHINAPCRQVPGKERDKFIDPTCIQHRRHNKTAQPI